MFGLLGLLMVFHGSGVYAPNEGPVDVGRIVEIARTPVEGGRVGDGCVVLLDHQAGKGDAGRRLREAMPEAVIQVRRYVQDWTSETPEDCADRFVEVMERCRSFTDHGTWANEQNLAAESLGKIGASDGHRMTWSEWQVVADYNRRVAERVRRVAPWIVLHYPAVAYGHGEDWGYDENRTPLPGFPLEDGVPRVAYELLRPGIDLCPILNVHPYAQRGAPVLDEWRGVRRAERVIALFPGKTLFAAETGQFDVRDPRAPDQILAIAYWLQGQPAFLGWCFFILDSPDPGHAMNNWSLNRAIEDAYRRMTRVARPRTWSPPGPTPQETPMPDWCPFATRAELPAGLYDEARDNGTVPALICDHIADGNGDPGPWWTSLLSQPPSKRASAHFWISKTGVLKQYVRLSAQAWSNGPKCQPDTTNPLIAAIVQHGVNPNASTISIEHEGRPGDVMPPAQVATSRRLHGWLSETFKIPLDRTHVVGHYQFDRCTRERCPGPSFPWAQILVKEAPVPDPTPPLTQTLVALQDKTYALAHQLRALKAQWQAAGYPQTAEAIDAAGNAAERVVSMTKGEK